MFNESAIRFSRLQTDKQNLYGYRLGHNSIFPYDRTFNMKKNCSFFLSFGRPFGYKLVKDYW